MGVRFRKSINLGGGARINVGKNGVGYSIGKKGVRASAGPSGRRVSVSIPGTGVSYEKRAGRPKKNGKGGCLSIFATAACVLLCVFFLSAVISALFDVLFGASKKADEPQTTPAVEASEAPSTIITTPEATPQITPTPSPTNAPAATPSPEPTAVVYEVLKNGSSGDGAKRLQERLIELRYLSGAADGEFGSKTEAAVKDFQTNNGLSADGIAGQKTQEALFSDSARPQTWVYIQPGTGEKYHSKSTCSNMTAPILVTLREAISKGYDSCGRCY